MLCFAMYNIKNIDYDVPGTTPTRQYRIMLLILCCKSPPYCTPAVKQIPVCLKSCVQT